VIGGEWRPCRDHRSPSRTTSQPKLLFGPRFKAAKSKGIASRTWLEARPRSSIVFEIPEIGDRLLASSAARGTCSKTAARPWKELVRPTTYCARRISSGRWGIGSAELNRRERLG
jgi:hypothetical protein